MNSSILAATAALFPLTVLAAPADGQQKESARAAEKLVARVTPEYAGRITFRIDPKYKRAHLEGAGAKLRVCAPNVREGIRAYGFYLRHVARVHLSWNGDNRSASQFVVPGLRVPVPEALPCNVAFNYCALSYTAIHWNKARWEKELDRLALSGYTHVLVTAGLEKVWQGFLRELECPRELVDAYVASPVFSAWWHMGNLEGEGGPVSQSLIDSEAELGRFIATRARELGMEPILQGYVGFLPHDMPEGGINGTILPQGEWCGFRRPSVLLPTSPAFPDLAKLWYEKLHEVYGMTAKAYGGDLFHEGGRKGGADLQACAKAVQEAMQTASPGADWLLQAWGTNPDDKLVEGTDPEHTIILELDKDQSAGHELPAARQGRRHVWCEVSNFGGNQGLYGGMPLLERLTGDAGGSIGIGLLSEGLETNPLYYALLTERVNTRFAIKRATFLKSYALSRYGSSDARLVRALSLLADSVYKPDRRREGCQENILCARPSLKADKVSTWSDPSGYYDADVVVEARSLMRQAAKQDPALLRRKTFVYDLADVTRQTLSDAARPQLARCREAFEKRDMAAFDREAEKFLSLIRRSADVLATSEHFLLGRFLQGVRERATNEADAEALVVETKRLLTTWSKELGTLDDYAHRQFAELMRYYYLPRWQAYFDSRRRELKGEASGAEVGYETDEGNTNNGTYVESTRARCPAVDAIEKAFPTRKIPLLTKPTKLVL